MKFCLEILNKKVYKFFTNIVNILIIIQIIMSQNIEIMN